MLNNVLTQINTFVDWSDLIESKPLVIGMLLSNSHKNCVSIAKPLGVSYDIIQKIFDAAPAFIKELNLFLLSLAITHSKLSGNCYIQNLEAKEYLLA